MDTIKQIALFGIGYEMCKDLTSILNTEIKINSIPLEIVEIVFLSQQIETMFQLIKQ